MIEIERKFLIAAPDWRAGVIRRHQITDGLLLTEDGRKLRVRLQDGIGTLTFKGQRIGLGREELTWPLSAIEVQALLSSHCAGRILTKTRHIVPFGGLDWEIDEYSGDLDGLIVAEVELPTEQHDPVLPPWIGAEVTNLPEWRQARLLGRVRERRP